MQIGKLRGASWAATFVAFVVSLAGSIAGDAVWSQLGPLGDVIAWRWLPYITLGLVLILWLAYLQAPRFRRLWSIMMRRWQSAEMEEVQHQIGQLYQQTAELRQQMAELGARVAGSAEAKGQEARLTIAVDMDTTGNDARLSQGLNRLGCAEMRKGETREIDVLCMTPDVPANGLLSFTFRLSYNPAVIEITRSDPNFLIAQAPGSQPADASQRLPSRSGKFICTVSDTGGPLGIEPNGIAEVGPGVLVRITITALAAGRSELTLTNAALIDINNDAVLADEVLNGLVMVEGRCP